MKNSSSYGVQSFVLIEKKSYHMSPPIYVNDPFINTGYGYGHGMPFHHFGFGLGCFGILIPLFLFFLAMKAFRMMVWGPRWGHMRHHGDHRFWGRHWEGEVPPMFEEWHKKAHNVPAGGGEPTEDKKE